MSERSPKTSRKVPPRLLYVGNTHEAFFQGLIAQAKQLGFDQTGYLVGIPGPGRRMQFVMVSNYPKQWQDRYLNNGYFMNDPTIDHAKSSTSPLAWSPALFERDLSTDLSKDARNFGFNHGWTQSIRDTNGRFGALTLARSEGEIMEDELAEKLPVLQWLALVTHGMLFRTLLARHQNELMNQLTEREIQLLYLAADGRNAEEMAKALGIVERTVNFHISNVLTKLQVQNKAQAVAMALRLGLIT